MLLRVGVVSYDRSRKILFLGSVRSHRFLVATKEKSKADGERAARFEKVRGGDIVNFQDLSRVLIGPREVVPFVVAEELYREGLLNLVGFSNFSKLMSVVRERTRIKFWRNVMRDRRREFFGRHPKELCDDEKK